MTTDERLSALESDLAATKVVNRVLLLLLTGAALVAYGTATAQPSAPQVAKAIYANEFGLVDDQGEKKAALRLGSDGGAILTLFGKKGKESAHLSETGLLLTDAEGNPVAMLARDETGPILQLKFGGGLSTVMASASKLGGRLSVEGTFVVSDKEGNSVFRKP